MCPARINQTEPAFLKVAPKIVRKEYQRLDRQLRAGSKQIASLPPNTIRKYKANPHSTGYTNISLLLSENSTCAKALRLMKKMLEKPKELAKTVENSVLGQDEFDHAVKRLTAQAYKTNESASALIEQLGKNIEEAQAGDLSKELRVIMKKTGLIGKRLLKK